jgi:hypothetical protein
MTTDLFDKCGRVIRRSASSIVYRYKKQYKKRIRDDLK